MTATALTYSKETDLCATFVECLPEGWTAYPETGGFDLIVVRAHDGFQIGVEAKLRLNAKVIEQAMEDGNWFACARPQPDCRAVLVPAGRAGGLREVCHALGITVIVLRADIRRDGAGKIEWLHGLARLGEGTYSSPFKPSLPDGENAFYDGQWVERCPVARIALPDWVPDVVAGDKSPVALTPWKVKAIQIAITLEKRGYVTRRDFKHFQISMSRWIDPYAAWLVRDGAGGWIAGPGLPDLRAQHPVNFGQIEADFEKWKAPDDAGQPGLFAGSGEK